MPSVPGPPLADPADWNSAAAGLMLAWSLKTPMMPGSSVMELGVAVMPSGKLARVIFCGPSAMAVKEIDAEPPGRMDTAGLKTMTEGDPEPEEPPPQPIQAAQRLSVRVEKKILKNRAARDFRLIDDICFGYRPGVALALRSPTPDYGYGNRTNDIHACVG
jgi:hypothetical protein